MAQQGLRARKTPNGTHIGILPAGGQRWHREDRDEERRAVGAIDESSGASLYPQETGGYVGGQKEEIDT